MRVPQPSYSEVIVYRYLPLIRPCSHGDHGRIPRAVVDLEAVHRQIAPGLDVELVEDVGFEVDGVPVDVLGGV